MTSITSLDPYMLAAIAVVAYAMLGLLAMASMIWREHKLYPRLPIIVRDDWPLLLFIIIICIIIWPLVLIVYLLDIRREPGTGGKG